jgi:hypothetical protein
MCVYIQAMCGSLEDYQRHIEGLKRGMSDATKTSELIRKDMNEYARRHIHIHTHIHIHIFSMDYSMTDLT